MGEDDGGGLVGGEGSQRPGHQRAVDTAAHKLPPLPVPAHRGEPLAVRVPANKSKNYNFGKYLIHFFYTKFNLAGETVCCVVRNTVL